MNYIELKGWVGTSRIIDLLDLRRLLFFFEKRTLDFLLIQYLVIPYRISSFLVKIKVEFRMFHCEHFKERLLFAFFGDRWTN